MIIKFVILTILFLCITQRSQSQFGPIPDHLIECYQKDVIILPMTITTLIDIIRKVEFNHEYTMDMRMIANSIMRRFWRDGIEKEPDIYPAPGVIPYSTAGFQSYKYSLLYSNLLPGTARTFPNISLTVHERCTLHFMVSSSVDPWERGDESEVCKDAAFAYRQTPSYKLTGNQKSACPIEKGVVFTEDFNTVNAGHIIGAIAMALQPMQLAQSALIRGNSRVSSIAKYNKLIDNLWAVTLAGDLAEIIVFQKPVTNNITMGPSGQWNNSYLPANYFMKASQNFIECGCWQNTNAEIIGSIDGLVMANEVISWINRMYTLKLSQILELYYTNIRGLAPGEIHACKRRDYFANDLNSQREIVKLQAENFADILAVSAPHSFVQDELYIKNNIDRVVKIFYLHTSKLLEDQISCPERRKFGMPKLQLYVIYDATWSPYYTLQFLMRLSRMVDVSHYGSNITVINGANGGIIVESANTEGDVYVQWQNSADSSKEVRSAGLLKGFVQLRNMIERNSTEKTIDTAVGFVTLIVGASSSITDSEYSKIRNLLKIMKNECPDMTFIYISNQANNNDFLKLTTLPISQYDYVITSKNNNQSSLLKDLDNIQNIPRMLIPPPCYGKKTYTPLIFEEFITPDLIYSYRIHPSYLCSSNRTITIEIKNTDYGNLDVCVSRTSFKLESNNLTSTQCNSAAMFDEIEFHINNQCTTDGVNLDTNWNNCKPIFITVIGRSSKKKCTEKDCRFPDQLRFTINVNGLQCVKDHVVTCASCQLKLNISITLFSMFLYLFKNYL
ncbi:hypothetical protein O3M35_007596 [Rhynocoris fuscipes]|uniref:Nicastrin n=1 Tax=Rhynocoris fuscipes TaxID=488301 RepID=A0AAW1DFP5_9HEMI